MESCAVQNECIHQNEIILENVRVSVCLKSVTIIFITSGRIMQSVVSTDPAR